MSSVSALNVSFRRGALGTWIAGLLLTIAGSQSVLAQESAPYGVDGACRNKTDPKCCPQDPVPEPDCGGDKTSFFGYVSHDHRHEAIDYQTEMILGDSACGSACGGATGAGITPIIGRMDALSLRRYRRSRSSYTQGSFGRDWFTEYDARIIQMGPDSYKGAGIGHVRIFLPESSGHYHTCWEENAAVGDTSVDGVYRTDNHHLRSVTLYDALGAVTSDHGAAVTVDMLEHDGQRLVFEIIKIANYTTSDRQGRLIRREDRNGNATVISYVHPATATTTDMSGNRNRLWMVDTVTDAYGRTAAFTYHSSAINGHFVIASIDFPNATTVSYGYDTSVTGFLNSITYPDGTASTFAYSHDATTQTDVVQYDDAGAIGTHRRKECRYSLSTFVDPDTLVVTNQVPGMLVQAKTLDGETLFMVWNSADTNFSSGTAYIYLGGTTLQRVRTSTVVTEIAYARNYVHDDNALRLTLDGYVWDVEVSATTPGQQRYGVVTDTFGRPTTYTWDVPLRALLETSFADGTHWEQTVNTFRQPLVRTDRLGRVEAWTYDSAGNRLTHTRAVGTAAEATWTWTYNGRGQPLTATDANGNTTDYVYDTAGQLIEITEPPDAPLGTRATRSFAYDTAGRCILVTDPQGRETAYAYDDRNRVIVITYADTSTETFTAGDNDEANLLVEQTDRNGNATTFAYDGYGRRILTTVAAGTAAAVTEVCTYPTGTDLKATCLQAGELTTYTYDHFQRRVATARQARDGTTLTDTAEYDERSRVRSNTDAYGRSTYLLYDINNRVVRTVHERLPGTLTAPAIVPGSSVTGTSGTGGTTTSWTDPRDTWLAGLTRSGGANPAYVITDQNHDAAGQLLTRIDGRGIRSTYAYDAQGRITAQVEADATVDSTGTATLLAPPEAARTEFTYDDQGNRLTAVLPRSFSRALPGGAWSAGSDGAFQTTWTYTGRNLTATETVADGLDAGSQVRPERGTTTWTYTLTRKVDTVTDPRSNTTDYGYSSCCDRLISITDPASGVTTIGYDSYGNRLSLTDPNGHTTAWTYDARHRVASQTNAEAETTLYAYDDNLTDDVGLDDPVGPWATHLTGLDLVAGSDGSAVLMTNPANETSLTIADGLGRTVRQVDGNGNATTIAYDAVVGGLVETAVTDALTHVTRTRSDGSGLVRQAVDAEAQVTTQSFDANGNRVVLRDPAGVGMDCTYDARNREILCTDTRSDVVTERATTFDAHGNVVVQTDALTKNDTCVYDARDRKIACTDRVNATTLFAYDLADNLIQIEDAEGGQTDYVYDSRNLLTEETFPTGQQGKTVRTYTYDAGRRLTSRVVTTDPSSAFSETTTYAYDDANRLLGRSYPDSLNDGFTYDLASRLTAATSDRYRVDVARAYDAAGRLTSESQTFRDGGLSGTTVASAAYTVGYTYDDANRTTTITYPDGAVVTRAYTDRNQLEAVTHTPSGGSATAIIDRLYDSAGRLTQTTVGNGLVETRTYTPDSHLVAEIAIPGVTDFTYVYDANRRKTQEANGILPAQTQTFSYDDQDRLTGWERPNVSDVQAWTLSLVGDWDSTTRNSVTETRTHTDVHELTGRTIGANPAIPLGYDAKGNLSDDGEGRVYAWDPENRLQTARVSSTASPTAFGLVATYQYDALGRRVAKTINGTTTRFLSAGAQVVEERDAPAIPPQAMIDGADSDGTAANAELTPASGGILEDSATIRVNFQPLTTLIPVGYYADKGKTYAMRTNALTYGWDATKTSDALSRNGAVPVAELDTLILMEPSTTAHVWEIALPNGTYPVIVVAGDPLATEQTNDLQIENQSVTDPDPSATATYTQGDFDGYAVLATVADGKLTISMRVSGDNAKLCFVEIGPEGTGISSGALDRLAALVAQATDQTAHTPPASTEQRQYVYGSYVDELLSYTVGATRYFTHVNHLYSIAATTNAAGAVVERYVYDAYGTQTVTNAAGTVTLAESGVGQSRGFTGIYTDAETELGYHRTRYLNRQMGRFVNRNPWFSLGGLRQVPYFMGAMPDNLALQMEGALRYGMYGSYGRNHRFNLYDFVSNQPSNYLEPFSELTKIGIGAAVVVGGGALICWWSGCFDSDEGATVTPAGPGRAAEVEVDKCTILIYIGHGVLDKPIRANTDQCSAFHHFGCWGGASNDQTPEANKIPGAANWGDITNLSAVAPGTALAGLIEMNGQPRQDIADTIDPKNGHAAKKALEICKQNCCKEVRVQIIIDPALKDAFMLGVGRRGREFDPLHGHAAVLEDGGFTVQCPGQ